MTEHSFSNKQISQKVRQAGAYFSLSVFTFKTDVQFLPSPVKQLYEPISQLEYIVS